ncbi:transcriptional regulator with XRE-family HTH domain [Paenibacillus anaericanus]|uniref:helix-turn-helix domain-containing protein n=1 Tax=Paenibacillus anaericanus TaxID=170367 RepID=UPI00277EFB48|nr:helix-turn-helix transcriptional regulator [Paenibacillus anaericanus]MDQ0087596.1 transcriptional regulator with XRE-family HTH domain [Paenibacillus anaericanus]
MTEKEILKLVGARIKALRKEQGLSQEALGEKGGFHFSYIGQIERGEKNVSLLSLAKVANALEVNVAQIFAYAYEESEQIDVNIQDIVTMLRESSPEKVRIAKNVIREIVRGNE